MKYILYNNNNFYDINLNRVESAQYTSYNIKSIIDSYGFNIKDIKEYTSLTGYRLIAYKVSNSTDLQTTLKLNKKQSFILLKYDFSYHSYITFDSKRKFMVSEDGVKWYNYLDETHYLEYKYKLDNNIFTTYTPELLEALNYINTNSKELDKIENRNIKYILLKVDIDVGEIHVAESVDSNWAIQIDNVDTTLKNNKASFNKTNYMNPTTIQDLDVMIVRLGCDDVIKDTLMEF